MKKTQKIEVLSAISVFFGATMALACLCTVIGMTWVKFFSIVATSLILATVATFAIYYVGNAINQEATSRFLVKLKKEFENLSETLLA